MFLCLFVLNKHKPIRAKPFFFLFIFFEIIYKMGMLLNKKISKIFYYYPKNMMVLCYHSRVKVVLYFINNFFFFTFLLNNRQTFCILNNYRLINENICLFKKNRKKHFSPFLELLKRCNLSLEKNWPLYFL